MPHLDQETILWSIHHLLDFGDTDIFPYPAEFAFLSDRREEIAAALSQEDIAVYRPMSPLTSLVPKSRYGFRTAHQLYPIDAIMFTAATVSIGWDIEQARLSAGNNVGFSYRFSHNDDNSMFANGCRYGDWLLHQHAKLFFADEGQYTHVVEADISDFFMRIYHHRLQNALAEATDDKHARLMIQNFIRHVRARQSFGIPVGGNASRLLAELALIDIDRALSAEGYDATRYVDDFRIFIQNEQDPYATLAFLAEHLSTNEGLSLAIAKTRIVPVQTFKEELELLSGEDDEAAEESASSRLLMAIYESEDNEADLEQLANLDLVGELQEEVDKNYWDIGKIRILLRCMKIVRDRGSIDFIRNNLSKLIPFIKEVVLLMEALNKEAGVEFQDLEEAVVDMILSSAASHMPVTRAWLLELFLRGVITISPQQARRLDPLTATSDQRAVVQLRSQLEEVHYFRQHKARMDEMTPWLQPTFIIAASCLPEDEYSTWLGNIRHQLRFPLAVLFCDWATARRRGT